MPVEKSFFVKLKQVPVNSPVNAHRPVLTVARGGDAVTARLLVVDCEKEIARTVIFKQSRSKADVFSADHGNQILLHNGKVAARHGFIRAFYDGKVLKGTDRR